MKLISCYVENFGCISNKEYIFDNNLTVINQENGVGKSTLVAFIKAMFYGLEGYKTNSVGFCDRLHFYPFSGGLFGGNLTFSVGGKEYKIERFFAEKSETGDSLKVYHNGVVTEEFGEDVGKAIFGLDKQSFERIIFVGSNEIEIKSTSSINSKLSEFLEGGFDDVSVDAAKDKLVTAQKRYKKSNKAVSEISREQDLILELNSKIANVKSISVSLEQKNSELFARKKEIEEVSNKIIEGQKLNKQISDYEGYENLLSLVESSKVKIDEITAKYENGIPSKTELKKINELVIKNRELSASQATSVSNEETAFYNSQSLIFANGVPDDNTLSKVLEDVQSLSSMQAQRELLGGGGVSEKEKLLLDRFSRMPPSSETIAQTDLLVEEYKKKSNEYQALDSVCLDNSSVKGGTLTAFKIIAILFGLVGVAGISLVFINTVIGACLLGVSVLSLLAVGFLYLNKKSTISAVDNSQKVKLKVELSSLEDKIKNVLACYGYLTGSGVIYDYVEFKNGFSAYAELLSKKQAEIQTLSNLDIKINGLTKKLNAFFEGYGVLTGSYFDRLTRLKNNISKHNDIKLRLKNASQTAEKIKTEIGSNDKTISSFYDKYGVRNVALEEIIKDVNLLGGERENLKELSLRAEEYKKQKNLTEKPQGESVDLSSLNQTLINMQDALALLKRSISVDETEVEKLGGYESDKKEAEERLALYKLKYRLLVATEGFLTLAEQNLKDKYVKPVKDEFLAYANLLEKVLGEKVVMTKDFEVNFERNGKPRSEKHLSSGQKSLCALCFRLALIKNMYKKTKPFIVLDDPFVYLDSEHLLKVKTLIEGLSKDMQILYFTCHESRDLS